MKLNEPRTARSARIVTRPIPVPSGRPSYRALTTILFTCVSAVGAGCAPGVVGGETGSGGVGPGTGTGNAPGTGSGGNTPGTGSGGTGPVTGSGGKGGTPAIGSGGSGTGNTGVRTGGASGSGGVAGTGGSGVAIAPPPSALPVPKACASNIPGPRFVRRLTVPEFNATIRDLFKDQAMAVDSVFDDPDVLGFKVDSNALVVQGLGAQRVRDNAEELARWAATNKLSQLSTCSTMDASCRRQFITSFGKRAFRAPLAEDRITAYDTLFAGEATFAEGVEAVVAAMLQSPNFLYRTELGKDGSGGTPLPLTPHEVASELSYLLWGTMPDDTLMAAADANALSTAAQIEQQAERMLSDPRAAESLMRFAHGWLQLGRLDTNVKNDPAFMLTDTLRASMLGETRALLIDTFNTGGGLTALLTGGYSFLNKGLAAHYGINAPALSDNAFTKVMYDSSMKRDPGLLGHASFLTGHAISGQSSPTQRGKMVRTRLLCLEIPPPPPNVDTALKPQAMPTTTREKYQQHAQGTCAACHRMMDPIGFGFEHYDGFGRYREQENGLTIDATGSFNGVREGDVPFTNLAGLAKYVAGSEDAKSCLIRYWSYDAYGSVSWPEDGCTYDAIKQYATMNSFSLKGVLKGIILAPHFSRRVPTP